MGQLANEEIGRIGRIERIGQMKEGIRKFGNE